MTSETKVSPIYADEHLSCDILVVGAGVVGLWIARLAARAGHRVIILEKRSAGTGASGGVLGALMPHMPERWNPKKQFQFEALGSLAAEVANLEAETGQNCDYRRCGRLMPLVQPHHRELAQQRMVAAAQVWDSNFQWNLLDAPCKANWPAVHTMPHGLVHETLAARISPRKYMAALKASLATQALLLEGEGFNRFDDAVQKVVTTSGRNISAGHTILAAGHETFDILSDMLARPAADFGTPVKGQAALLQAEISDDVPLVFHDGVYAVPHEGGTVAIGSTSETSFDDSVATDAKLDNLIERARVLCPVLETAAVLERWAGLRPKAIKRDPMIGAVPDRPDITVATGGFKITFGIAHKMAACALELASVGHCGTLPESFRLETHLR
ncbi:MAG: FAD-binding oxidoreductase [Hyphomicrobiales bacterium]|nr:FAD-binding oxidoreductase [Hyphomicrobiales bacterium]MCP4997695.1 FAD-binding oxidoreductase [Hyphomicrobiales bacterium]